MMQAEPTGPNSRSDKLPWAVICDFDGTAIVGDIADALALRFLGDVEFQNVNMRFERNEISFRELLHRLYEPITASEDEIHAFARAHAHLRPGFIRLLTVARDLHVPFTLASGGLDIYIHPVLALLPTTLASTMQLRANHAEPHGAGLTISFPYADMPNSCGECGSCKGALVHELQNAGYRVVAIGDGNADRCMAGIADVLFARDRLSAWCDRLGISYTPFETLDTVADFLETHAQHQGAKIANT